ARNRARGFVSNEREKQKIKQIAVIVRSNLPLRVGNGEQRTVWRNFVPSRIESTNNPLHSTVHDVDHSQIRSRRSGEYVLRNLGLTRRVSTLSLLVMFLPIVFFTIVRAVYGHHRVGIPCDSSSFCRGPVQERTGLLYRLSNRQDSCENRSIPDPPWNISFIGPDHNIRNLPMRLSAHVVHPQMRTATPIRKEGDSGGIRRPTRRPVVALPICQV